MQIFNRQNFANARKLNHYSEFNKVGEEKIPFDQTLQEIIWDLVKDYDYPVCFDFPSGHIDNNMVMILGTEVELYVIKKGGEGNFNIVGKK